MQVLAGPFAAAAAVLAVAGVAKVARPGPTAAALRAARLPAHRAVVVALGGAEAAIGVGGLTVGSRLFGALVAACYLGFAGFVAVLRRRGTDTSCGCFGQPDTPPTRLHLGLNLAAAAVALLAVRWPVRLGSAVRALPPGDGLLLLALVAACVWLAYLSLSLLPGTLERGAGRGRAR